MSNADRWLGHVRRPFANAEHSHVYKGRASSTLSIPNPSGFRDKGPQRGGIVEPAVGKLEGQGKLASKSGSFVHAAVTSNSDSPENVVTSFTR